jgi:hypothetical protein
MVGASACVYPQLDWFWVGGKVRPHIGISDFFWAVKFSELSAQPSFSQRAAAWAQRSDFVDTENRLRLDRPLLSLCVLVQRGELGGCQPSEPLSVFAKGRLELGEDYFQLRLLGRYGPATQFPDSIFQSPEHADCARGARRFPQRRMTVRYHTHCICALYDTVSILSLLSAAGGGRRIAFARRKARTTDEISGRGRRRARPEEIPRPSCRTQRAARRERT